MYFQTFSDFLHMGGHGWYVWLCWGFVIASIVIGVLYVRLERQKLLKKFAQNARRQRLNSQQALSSGLLRNSPRL